MLYRKSISLLFSKEIARFEHKCMGINRYVPYVLLLGEFSFVIALYAVGLLEYKYIMASSELLLPIGGEWYGIFITRGVLELPGSNLYFTYDISRIYLGTLRILREYVIYAIIVVAQLSLLFAIAALPFADLLMLLLLTLTQILFFAGLGFFLSVVLKETFFAVVGCAAYIVFFIFTKGEGLSFLCIYQFLEEPSLEYVTLSFGRDIALCVLLFAVAQIILSKMQPREIVEND